MPKLAVLGRPVSHSRSPAMHNAALAELGLAGEWSYEAIEVSPAGFEALVRAMAHRDYAGANVTVPHKVAALACADVATDAAREIGAANTLSFADDRVAADNTDATGILDSLPRSPKGLRALVLGAGGSARAAVWALTRAGAAVSIWNRTEAKAEGLARELGARPLSVPGSSPLPVGDYDLVLNATTVGMQGSATGSGTPEPRLGADPDCGPPDLKRLRLDADGLSEEQIVVDLVYGTAETQLAAAGRARGATVVDGIEVLVHQGAASLRLWTGTSPPVETMRSAARGTEWPETTVPNT
jgi:shikimate dehydrogenase